VAGHGCGRLWDQEEEEDGNWDRRKELRRCKKWKWGVKGGG
jgi:hypothetical protein